MFGIARFALAGATIALATNPTPRSVSPPPAHTRTYYVAADTVLWDYAPGPEINRITGQPYDSVALMNIGNDSVNVGHRYLKAVYRQYTDSTFTTLQPRDAAWEHLGILGPLMRAVVGSAIHWESDGHLGEA